MIVHIGYDVCVESEEVLMILSPRTASGPAAHLLQAARRRGAFTDVPPASGAPCRAYLLLQAPAKAKKTPPPLHITASCLSPGALHKRLQAPNLLIGKDTD